MNIDRLRKQNTLAIKLETCLSDQADLVKLYRY